MYPQQKSNKGKIALVALLLLVGFLAYNYFLPKRAGAEDQLVSDAPQGTLIGEDLLRVLDKIESIKLDKNIFADRTFLSLQDLSVDIVPQPTGRTNPFAPLNAPAAPVTTKTTKR
jgi:hypothetical protein